MNSAKELLNKKVGILLAIGGSLLIWIPTVALAAFADEPMMRDIQSQPSNVNESPVNQPADSQMPPTEENTTPLPQEQQRPAMQIKPVNGQISIKLINQTGDPVTYQLIGDTKPRMLTSEAQVMLRELQTPITLTFQRPNGSLIRVIPQVSSEPGVLEVTLDKTTNLGTDKNALIVEETGLVFVN